MSKKLKELRLRGEDGNPTEQALSDGYCTSTPLKYGTPYFMWNRQKIEELMGERGYQRLDPQEVKARELADNWVQVHKQWQKAIYGVEEELLIEEAQDIKKEARRRGLTERVNALLRELKYDGEPITQPALLVVGRTPCLRAMSPAVQPILVNQSKAALILFRGYHICEKDRIVPGRKRHMALYGRVL
jgi:hypothetical protein